MKMLSLVAALVSGALLAGCTSTSPSRSRPVGTMTSSAPADGQAWTVPDVGLELVWVPPGSCQMGPTDGLPVRTVQISRGYWIGKYEVTQAEYETLTGSNPSYYKGPRNPVETVSSDDASAFCTRITARERAAGRLPAGYEYRLPTEAEWEYAAQGGPLSRYIFSSESRADKEAWSNAVREGKTHPVGEKQPNGLGLHDMSGNVWEWCLDSYGGSCYGRSAKIDPVDAGPAVPAVPAVPAIFRPFRGGVEWFHPVARFVRSTYQVRFGMAFAHYRLGFRACLAPQSAGK